MDVIWIGLGLALTVALSFRLIRINHRKEQRALESLGQMVEERRAEVRDRPELPRDRIR